MPTVDLDVAYPAWAEPLLEPARYKGAVGGRARGASHFFAGYAVEEMVCDPDLRFVCIREVQRALRYSAKSLVEGKIRSMGVGHLFDILTPEIRRVGGSGVMIFEGMQDHTADSIKSLEDFGRAWVEEAHSLSERSLRLLRPTIRAPGSELWFSWNRESPEDAVDKFFREREGDPNVRLIEATYKDNPFLPDEMRQEAEDDYAADPDLAGHVWGGGYFLGGSGRVYSSFLAKPWPAGNIDESIEDTGGDLLVGIDFNVDPMSAVVAVRAVDECLILDAIEVPGSNTAELADEIKERYPNRRYVACPDPAGNQRKTSAPVGQTDFTILKRAGFEVRAPSAAPPVKDRVNNTNDMLHDKKAGTRRCRLHPDAKALRTGLANLVYKEGTSQQQKGRYDHICFTGDTPILTDRGEVAIRDIRPGDRVLTRWGFFPVAVSAMTHPDAEVYEVEMANGRRITATGDHPFWVAGEGFVPLRELTQSAILFAWQTPNQWSTEASRSGAIRTPRILRTGTTSHPAERTALLALVGSTKSYGGTPTAPFPMDTISTIGMAIHSTTTSPTLSASPALGTSPATAQIQSGWGVMPTLSNWSQPASWRQSGTVPRMGASGTESTPGGCGSGGAARLSSVPTVGRTQKRTSRHGATNASVPRSAKPPRGERLAWMTKTAPANGAVIHSASINTGQPALVRGVAEHTYAIRPAGNAPVYNLTVDGPHEYFAGGVLVSNCDALGYLLWQEFNVLENRKTENFDWRLV